MYINSAKKSCYMVLHTHTHTHYDDQVLTCICHKQNTEDGTSFLELSQLVLQQTLHTFCTLYQTKCGSPCYSSTCHSS